MNTLTAERANELVEAVAARMPFPAAAVGLAGDWTPLQIDLGARPNANGWPPADVEHDRAGIDDADTAERAAMEDKPPVWWFETWPSGGTGASRVEFSTFGPDADPADVAAWIAEQARAAGSPAAVAVPAASPATQDHLVKLIAEQVADRLVEAERALRAQFEHGGLKGRGHEVWSTGSHMPHPSDIFRANVRFVDAVNVRTRTLTPDGVPTFTPTQAIITPHKDPARPLLTVEFYTPRVGPVSAPNVRTRHYKTGIGAARAIVKHLAHLETGMPTEAGRP